MLMLLAIAFGILLVAPSGGSYRTLALGKIKWSALFIAGAVVQFALTPVLSRGSSSLGPTIAWMIGALLLITACAANGQNSGFLVAACGVSLNALVIALNTGMPVYAGALELVGTDSGFSLGSGTIYFLSNEAVRLLFLADVVPVPGPPGIRSVASLGDLLICVGVAAAILQMSDRMQVTHASLRTG